MLFKACIYIDVLTFECTGRIIKDVFLFVLKHWSLASFRHNPKVYGSIVREMLLCRKTHRRCILNTEMNKLPLRILRHIPLVCACLMRRVIIMLKIINGNRLVHPLNLICSICVQQADFEA